MLVVAAVVAAVVAVVVAVVVVVMAVAVRHLRRDLDLRRAEAEVLADLLHVGVPLQQLLVVGGEVAVDDAEPRLAERERQRDGALVGADAEHAGRQEGGLDVRDLRGVDAAATRRWHACTQARRRRARGGRAVAPHTAS